VTRQWFLQQTLPIVMTQSRHRVILKKIEAQTQWLVTRSIQPGTLLLTGQITMADQIQLNVQLPAFPDPITDIKHGVLSVLLADPVGSEPVLTTVLPGDDLVVGPFSGPQDSVVSLSYVFVDDAGNKSEPSEATLVLVDNFPPAAPGALGIVTTGETFAEPVDPGQPSESADPGEPSESEDPGEPSESA
jgi:hypothetical protein